MQVTIDFAFIETTLFQATAIPALASCLFAATVLGVGRLAARRWPQDAPGIARCLASAGVAAALLLGEGLAAGLPALPPTGATDKLVLLAGAGLVAGVALDALRLPGTLLRAIALLWALVAGLWIGWPRLAAGTDAALLLALCLAAATLIAVHRITSAAASGLVPVLLIAGVAFGLAAVAAASGALAGQRLALALGCAALGLAVLGLPNSRSEAGAALFLPTLAVLAGLAAALAHYGPGRAAPLLLLLPGLFAPRVLDHFHMSPQRGAGLRDNLAGPLLLAVLLAVTGLCAYGAMLLLAPLAATSGGVG